jgi:hypothetical protein
MELPNNNRTATDELPSCARVTATRIAGVVALFLTVALMPRLASAQMSTWNVSIYNQLTESADDNSMYGTTQVYDNSSGWLILECQCSCQRERRDLDTRRDCSISLLLRGPDRSGQ